MKKIPFVKLHTCILASILSAALVLVGCSKSGSAKVDSSPIEKSFAAAESTVKAAADKAVDAIKKADYSAATAELQKLVSNVKLTDEQKKAVTDVLAQIQKAVADMGSKAADEASKALGDAQKSLGK
jgi:PBP1b-binding outer membrane lipoprotein LpoB